MVTQLVKFAHSIALYKLVDDTRIEKWAKQRKKHTQFEPNSHQYSEGW